MKPFLLTLMAIAFIGLLLFPWHRLFHMQTNRVVIVNQADLALESITVTAGNDRLTFANIPAGGKASQVFQPGCRTCELTVQVQFAGGDPAVRQFGRFSERDIFAGEGARFIVGDDRSVVFLKSWFAMSE